MLCIKWSYIVQIFPLYSHWFCGHKNVLPIKYKLKNIKYIHWNHDRTSMERKKCWDKIEQKEIKTKEGIRNTWIEAKTTIPYKKPFFIFIFLWWYFVNVLGYVSFWIASQQVAIHYKTTSAIETKSILFRLIFCYQVSLKILDVYNSDCVLSVKWLFIIRTNRSFNWAIQFYLYIHQFN